MYSKPIALLKEDDAVSPVIGVILMVAITVILAAVIAAFVLGIGDSDEVAPQTSFSADQDGDTITVEIVSGDSLDVEDIDIRDTDAALLNEPGGGSTGIAAGESGALSDVTELDDTDEWGVGESVDFELEPDAGDDDGSFNIVWTGDGEDVLWTVDYEYDD